MGNSESLVQKLKVEEHLIVLDPVIFPCDHLELRKAFHPKEYTEGQKPLWLIVVIQGVSRLVDITAGGDFLGLCDQKSSDKHVSDFGQLWSYGQFLIPVHALV